MMKSQFHWERKVIKLALRVWLPLIDNLNNQGISNVSITNNGATTGSGKLGSCYYLNGSSNYIQISNLPNPKNITVAFWMKRNATTNSRQFMFTAWNGVSCEMTASNLIRCYVAPSHGVCDYTTPVTVDSGWIHVTYTFEDKVGSKLYINGTLITETSSSSSIQWSTTTGRIGNYSNMYFNGCMNDFRFYDSVLSPREIKSISLGLVVHYPLSREGFGGDNILPNTWAEERTFEYPSSSYYDRWSGVTSIVPAASQYTLSFWAKSTVAGDKIRTHFYSPNTTTTCVSSQGTTKTASDGNMDFTLSTEWKRYWVTYSQNTTSAVKHIICPRMGAVGNTQGICYGTGTVSIKQIKLEEGDTPTPWIPATTDAEYAAMGLNDGIEYDCSGYKHNGTKIGAFTYSSDTPKHNVSTVFNGSNHVAVGRLPIKDELTYNWWGYVDDWSKTLGGAMVCSVEGGGMGHQNGGSTYLWFICGTGTSSNSYGSGYQMPTPSAGWHMFTETWDGYSFKVYLDGQLGFTNNRYTTKTPVYYDPSYNFLFIGGESSSSATTPGDHFVGKLSDFRIYATALNADQIMELYHTGISLANNSTLLASEFVEV